MSDHPEHVVIIGSGPAGWAAAIYAARASLNPLCIEGAMTEENRIKGTLPKGQLALTSEVENYPGFPAGNLNEYLKTAISDDRKMMLNPDASHGIDGPDLVELMRQQATNFGTRVITDDVVDVDCGQHPFVVKTLEGQTIRALSIIIATGARANYLGLESEDRFKNRGVSACAVCDGALPRFRNKPLVVVGGGDSAMEEATFLTKFASKLTVIHRRDKLRASKVLQDRAMKNEKISFLWNSAVEDILGADLVTGVSVKNLVTGKVSEVPCAGVFVAIGHRPNTALFHGQVDLDAKGYIRTTEGSATSVPGVFAAGDVQDSVYRQAITAAGSGCMAAIDAERFLEAGNHNL